MIILDKLISRGVRFVLEKLAQTAERELNDPERLRESLLHAESLREAGEIDDEEFLRIERDLLERMRAARGEDRDEIEFVRGPLEKVTGVEVDVHVETPEGGGGDRASRPERPSPAKTRRRARSRTAGRRR